MLAIIIIVNRSSRKPCQLEMKLSHIQCSELGSHTRQDLRVRSRLDLRGRRSGTVLAFWMLAADAFRWCGTSSCFAFFRVGVRDWWEDLAAFVAGVLDGLGDVV